MVDPVVVGAFWAWFTFIVFLVYLLARSLIRLRIKDWSPKHQWKIFAAFSVFMLLPWTVYLELFAPPIGGVYSDEAAGFWIRRAANESDPGRKSAEVSRLVLSSRARDAIGKNALVVKNAIGTVGDSRERCELRRLLAGLAGIPDRPEREAEAREECARVSKI
jgi:hypothetical protein